MWPVNVINTGFHNLKLSKEPVKYPEAQQYSQHSTASILALAMIMWQAITWSNLTQIYDIIWHNYASMCSENLTTLSISQKFNESVYPNYFHCLKISIIKIR